MAKELIMPKLGMSMKEGTVVEWLKQKGDSVKKGEPVAVISSEKIEKDIEAPEDGTLLEVVVSVNETAVVGKAIGYIGKAGETVNKEPSGQSPQPARQETAASTETAERETPEKPVMQRMLKPRVSPAARKLADKEGIDINTVEGSGPKGRITRADVELAVREQSDISGTASEKSTKKEEVVAEITEQRTGTQSGPDFPEEAAVTRPLSGIRKIIADRMHRSLLESAQLTINMKADVTELMQVIKKANEQYSDSNVKFSITAFIARAVVLALKKHPMMNCTIEQDEITCHDTVRLGMAVALENGLAVPVIQGAEEKSISEMARAITSLSKQAKEGMLDGNQLKGSTFTITSLGGYDVEFFTPVLNPPEAGILGIGRAVATPVFIGDQVEKRFLLPLSLTFDHRVLDGMPASAFLQDVKRHLETPYTMFLQ